MRAWVVEAAGGPEVLTDRELADPVPEDGQVLIEVRAFGLNRAEAVTRAGGSGDAVRFPRVVGIECVGRVLAAPGTDLAVGQTVAAVMGEMGRAYDGSYAELTVVPRRAVYPLQTDLDWVELAAVPETFFTAWGCLDVSGGLRVAPRVVMRPGASALGLAVAQIATDLRGEVVGVTRSGHKASTMLAAGVTDVAVTDGPVVEQVRERWPEGATSVIDTVASTDSVADDLDLLAPGGRVCLAGSLADSYGTATVDDSVDAALVRADVGFFASDRLTADRDTARLQQLVDRVADGSYRTNIAEVVGFDEVPDVHRGMEENRYCGKVVVDLSADGR